MAGKLDKKACDAAQPREKAYRLTDGLGLSLLIHPGGGKYWRWEYRRPLTGKRNTISLGVYPTISPSEARKRRDAHRVRLLVDRVDPGAEKADAKADAASRTENTFAKMAEQWLVERSTRGRGRSPKTLKKDNSFLSKWIIPALGKMPVADITARDVKLLLNKMRDAGREASAVRAKMTVSAVLKFAINEHLPGITHDVTSTITVESPKVRHRASLTEPDKIGPLLSDIWEYGGSITVTSALKLACLTALRANELCGARWEEIDLDARMWTVPPHRMKGTSRRRGEDAQPHHVPLCAEAVEILAALKPYTGRLEHVFPGAHSRKVPIATGSLNAALRRMGYGNGRGVCLGKPARKVDFQIHGVRAMFRTLCEEQLDERVTIIEAQLSHAVRDANGEAYARAKHMDARRRLMDRYGEYLRCLRTGEPFETAPNVIAGQFGERTAA